MLTALQLHNFKSWKDTGTIRLAPVTAFFGSNSSGKTSILQSLLLLKQTSDSPDRRRVLDLNSPTSIVDLGTYRDILYGHNSNAPLKLSLGWEAANPVRVHDLLERARKKSSILVNSRAMGIDIEVVLDGSSAYVQRLNYQLDYAHFTMKRRAPSEPAYDLSSDVYSFVRTQGRAWPLPPPTKCYGFPDQVRLYYQNASFLSDLELGFEEAMGHIKYLGPLREDPRRQYIFSGGTPNDVGRRGELAVDALIASGIAGERNSRGWQQGSKRRRLPGIPLERHVAEWLAELGLIDSFDVEALDDRETVYRVTVRRSRGSVPVLLTDVGFGISQVLPVLVLLAYAKAGDTVILEQPEIHLHPAVQSGLADVVLETALARNVQVIVESHSEHFLTRLQRRIAEETIGRGLKVLPQDVALYFCRQREGESRIDELRLDLFGNITNWPDDFFGDPLGDSVAMVEAAAKRQRVSG